MYRQPLDWIVGCPSTGTGARTPSGLYEIYFDSGQGLGPQAAHIEITIENGQGSELVPKVSFDPAADRMFTGGTISVDEDWGTDWSSPIELTFYFSGRLDSLTGPCGVGDAYGPFAVDGGLGLGYVDIERAVDTRVGRRRVDRGGGHPPRGIESVHTYERR